MERTLTIQLKGALSDAEHVNLSDFITSLETVREILQDIDRLYSGTPDPTSDFQIVDLKIRLANIGV